MDPVTVGKKPHYGWLIVAAEFLLTGMCVGTLVNSMGVFIKPVSSALGIERSQFALVLSITSLVSTVCYPFWGRYMKKGSIRLNYIASAVVVPLILLGYSFSTRLWQFYLLSGMLGIVSASVTSLATASLLNRWFAERQGLAVSIATSGSGLVPALFIPLITVLLERQGWKYAYRWLGAVYCAVVLLCALLLLRDRPEQMGLAPYGAADGKGAPVKNETGTVKSRALRQASFYCLLFGAFFCGLIYSGINNNVQAYLTDIGHSPAMASSFVSLSMAVMILMKLVMGLLFDKYGFLGCCALAMGGALGASLLLLSAGGGLSVGLYALSFGTAAAFPSLCCSYGTLHLFGTRDFSSICSLVTSALYLGMASGSVTVSLIYDLSGSYAKSWVLTAFLSAAAFALMYLAVKSSGSVKAEGGPS